ncbi:MAG TPA: chemotaxis response regulator protein-glutamate methylesterase [Chloroflexota bacterium]|nr:chemotaxis response regulator protein-glutamate methylesterase [Chloroflexota bacterium]
MSDLSTGTPAAALGVAAGRRIRVLIADDSALMRQGVRRVLEVDPEIEVLDTARDGLDALLKVEKLQPDVITMDVEMPRVDGLTALRMLMERSPRPVVMFSSLTAAGTETTVRALGLGAVDFIQKPSGQLGTGFSGIAGELIAKVKTAARARVRRPHTPRSPHPPHAAGDPARPRGAAGAGPAFGRAAAGPAGAGHSTAAGTGPLAPLPTLFGSGPAPDRLLVVGSSTGGPRALAELLAGLPGDLPGAALIVQHLPAGFTRSLAERLDQGSALAVAEAQEHDALATGRALVAPGDFHLKLAGCRVTLDQGARRHGVRPSVDTTLEDAAEAFGPAVLAVILTGMGEDGTAGARAVKAAGGVVLAEDESTCVVFGMPRSVIAAGLADEVVPLDQMAAAIRRHLAALPARAARRAIHV